MASMRSTLWIDTFRALPRTPCLFALPSSKQQAARTEVLAEVFLYLFREYRHAPAQRDRAQIADWRLDLRPFTRGKQSSLTRRHLHKKQWPAVRENHRKSHEPRVKSRIAEQLVIVSGTPSIKQPADECVIVMIAKNKCVSIIAIGARFFPCCGTAPRIKWFLLSLSVRRSSCSQFRLASSARHPHEPRSTRSIRSRRRVPREDWPQRPLGVFEEDARALKNFNKNLLPLFF